MGENSADTVRVAAVGSVEVQDPKEVGIILLIHDVVVEFRLIQVLVVGFLVGRVDGARTILGRNVSNRECGEVASRKVFFFSAVEVQRLSRDKSRERE
jgi:hypothetical protein